jgi:hypothetical protein
MCVSVYIYMYCDRFAQSIKLWNQETALLGNVTVNTFPQHAHATIAEVCFLCVGSVQNAYKRGEFRSWQFRVQSQEPRRLEIELEN